MSNEKRRLEAKDMPIFEAPRPQGGASRARSGEQNVSQGSLIYIVPLPACR